MLPRISRAELDELAGAWNLKLDETQAEQLGAVADDLLTLLDNLEGEQPLAAEPVAATREAGERPPEAEDPLNAIVRRCHVKADEPGEQLAGLRVAVKDSIAVAGIPLTLGSRVMDGFVPNV